MAHETVTKWRCDRCSREAATTTDYPPIDWRAVVMSTTSRAEAEAALTFELCGGCAGQVSRLLEPVSRPRGPITSSPN
jgi:hypothetical protein